MLFVFLFSTIETARKINYANTKRMHCLEYMLGIAFLVLHIPLGVLALIRFSSTSRGNTCVVGLPKDILIPSQVAIAAHNVYAAARICWPLLRIKHEKIRAWGIRTMIGVFLCAVGGSLTFLILTEISAAYMYYTELICLLLAAMMFGSIAAFIMTLNPAYKNFSNVSRSTPGEEAQNAAADVQCHNCSNCQLPLNSAILVSGQDVRTLNSAHLSGRHKQNALSVLDSKSVAEFLFDEDCSVPAPAFSGCEQSPAQGSGGLPAMVPLQMMSWSYLRDSERMKWPSGRLAPGTKRRTQPYPLHSARLALPKNTSFFSNKELCSTDPPEMDLTVCPHDSNAGAVGSTVSQRPLTSGDSAAQLNSGAVSQFHSPQSSIAPGIAQKLQLPDLSSPAMRAAFLDAPAIQGPTCLSKVGVGSR
ncbi:hypothetical protein BCR37DRAFT_390344 [Protomyces lactucae-debilis]|uniref:Transmembrane protein n=1 Tax=Protomyces lactucae-debilis TaxID=2754530 RepID=A0A1Y2FWB4_PROLT|nr:uncharacterized protein BCR37DRAFT_390344 [Protomyces lactucae-debilis]ORY87827.1 hypothetical protein BCR37DRAFT_390344 [Protomyces lactucae-debilis]